jgi:(2R)-sulfolactate sulfo-lyase subunit alpha
VIDKRFVLLNENDNIIVCCKQVKAVDNVNIDGQDFVMETNINVGHKLSRTTIKTGDNIIKYGASIGSATENISAGSHVHMHNIKSDYIPSHTRQSKVGEE